MGGGGGYRICGGLLRGAWVFTLPIKFQIFKVENHQNNQVISLTICMETQELTGPSPRGPIKPPTEVCLKC